MQLLCRPASASASAAVRGPVRGLQPFPLLAPLLRNLYFILGAACGPRANVSKASSQHANRHKRPPRLAGCTRPPWLPGVIRQSSCAPCWRWARCALVGAPVGALLGRLLQPAPPRSAIARRAFAQACQPGFAPAAEAARASALPLCSPRGPGVQLCELFEPQWSICGVGAAHGEQFHKGFVAGGGPPPPPPPRGSASPAVCHAAQPQPPRPAPAGLCGPAAHVHLLRPQRPQRHADPRWAAPALPRGPRTGHAQACRPALSASLPSRMRLLRAALRAAGMAHAASNQRLRPPSPALPPPPRCTLPTRAVTLRIAPALPTCETCCSVRPELLHPGPHLHPQVQLRLRLLLPQVSRLVCCCLSAGWRPAAPARRPPPLPRPPQRCHAPHARAPLLASSAAQDLLRRCRQGLPRHQAVAHHQLVGGSRYRRRPPARCAASCCCMRLRLRRRGCWRRPAGVPAGLHNATPTCPIAPPAPAPQARHLQRRPQLGWPGCGAAVAAGHPRCACIQPRQARPRRGPGAPSAGCRCRRQRGACLQGRRPGGSAAGVPVAGEPRRGGGALRPCALRCHRPPSLSAPPLPCPVRRSTLQTTCWQTLTRWTP